jgi:hypothetical protein
VKRRIGVSLRVLLALARTLLERGREQVQIVIWVIRR